MTPLGSAGRDLVPWLTGFRPIPSSHDRPRRRPADRLESSMRALAAAAGALRNIPDGPDQVLDGFAHAAIDVFDAPWALVIIDSPAFAERPRVAAATITDVGHPCVLPAPAERFLDAVGGEVGGGADPPAGDEWRAVPLPGEDGARWVGWLAIGLPIGRHFDDTDRVLLPVISQQIVAAVRTAHRFALATQYRDEADRVRATLARTREREVVERERARIARDLHDTVAQQVLGIGMKLEGCRRAVAGGQGRNELAGPLLEATDLAQATVERIRSAIADLTADRVPSPSGVRAALREALAGFDQRGLVVSFEVGRAAPAVPSSTERALAMVVREALANAVVHGGARRAVVRLHLDVASECVVVSVSDDGCGDPAELRANLRDALLQATDDRHPAGHRRGLANLYERVREVGGVLDIERSSAGGIRIEAVVPAEVYLGG